MNNLRLIGLAVLNYETAIGHLPPGVVDHDDDHRNGLHSGFIHPLPYLNHSELYQAYDHSVSWISPANRRVTQTTVNTFLCPANQTALGQDDWMGGARSDYAFCKGDLAYLSRHRETTGLFDINSKTRLSDIPDGHTQTIMIGEAASTHELPATFGGAVTDLRIGQAWASADFDGTNASDVQGGRGSVLAVTAQNPGKDGVWETADDVLTPLNQSPADVSIDWAVGPDAQDQKDRVRGFYSQHSSGANFIFADCSVKFIDNSIDLQVYRHLSTRDGGVIYDEF